MIKMSDMPHIENYGTLQYIQHVDTVILNVGGLYGKPVKKSDGCMGTAVMNYVEEEQERDKWVERFSSAHTMAEFCRSTLYAFYCDVLADYPDSREILISSDFIQSLFPLMKGIKGEKDVKNTRVMIRKYTLGE